MPSRVAEIEVWWSVINGQADCGILSPAELDRAKRFRFPEDRVRFIKARVMLRRVLARYAGQSAANLEFIQDQYGKPRLLHSEPLHFNLSHSADLAALAVSANHPVGIDVERFRPVRDMARVLRMIASAGEKEAFVQLPEGQRTGAFFSCWTRKEAIVKALGTGLSRSLQQIEVPLHSEISPVLLTIDGNPFSLFTLGLLPGYAAALAVSGDVRNSRIITHAWREGPAE